MYSTLRPILTVDCILFKDQSIVLIRRGFKPFKGILALPGGLVDIGESREQVCSREMREEAGVEMHSDELELIGVYSDPGRDDRGHYITIAFLGKSKSYNLIAGDDAISVELVQDLREKDIAFDHKQIIEDGWSLYNS